MHPIWQSIYAGKWYSTHAKPLRQARLMAKQLCWQLNQSVSEDERRDALVQQLLPNVTSITIGHNFYCDYGFNIHSIGNVMLGKNVVILDAGKVQLGDNLHVGNSVVICALHHPKNTQRRNQGLQRAEPVIIGHNVTLGNKVSVLPGAVIPDNTAVADGEVITHCTFI